MAVIHIIRTPATPEQTAEMLQAFDDLIKLAVDVDLAILAGGGNLHADCENMLLQDGSRQENIWGADWVPDDREVRFVSFINIRPNQNNPSMTILDPAIQDQVERIVRSLLEKP